MAEYPSLAALRSGLTTDDADERGNAYGAVLNAEGDVQPSDVLDSDPSTESIQALVDANVVPRSELRGGGAAGPSVAQRDEEIIGLLEEIRDAVQEGGI